MVLVTGASGFLGQYLVAFLSGKNQQVRAQFYQHPPSQKLLALPGISWMQCDLLDVESIEELLENIDEIYHCAAIVSYDPGLREEMIHFNTESTTNLVNLALEKGIRKMVYVSSIAAIPFDEQRTKITDENSDPAEYKFVSAYGLSKYLAEMEVWRGTGEGLNAVIINPGIILGAGDWNRSSAQLMKLADKEFPFYTDGSTAWVDVNDVVEIMYRLMHSAIEQERYILSAGNFKYKEILDMMATMLHRKQPGIKAGKLLTGIVWRMHEIKRLITKKSPLITKESALNATLKSSYDNKKLLSVFPDFTYSPLETTISKMADMYKK